LISGLENDNEHYTDILEVGTNFVTETMQKDSVTCSCKIHSLCEKEVNFILFIPCIIDD